jgi:enolase-phosphatase E1
MRASIADICTRTSNRRLSFHDAIHHMRAAKTRNIRLSKLESHSPTVSLAHATRKPHQPVSITTPPNKAIPIRNPPHLHSRLLNSLTNLNRTNRAPIQFPYALRALPRTLATEWDSPSFTPYREAFPPAHRTSPSALESHVRDLMSQDLKIPYLKALQGYLWQRGYESGEIRCPLFPDVYPSLVRWHNAGLKIVIYSSGSVAAQKLLFQYTDEKSEADLRYLIDGFFDTVSAGPKTEKESYERIVGSVGKGVGEEADVRRWLFLSDNVREVRAAKEAGLRSFVVVREGNEVLSEEEKSGLVLVGSLDEVVIHGV